MRHMLQLLCIPALLAAIPAVAIETESILLRHGAVNDGEVVITRDEPGNLLLDDAFTSPTTLSTLLGVRTDHGALDGLDDDDHPQYLTTTRHEDAHDATFNDALAVSGDVNGNATLGAHVSDSQIHLLRGAEETINGAWNFAEALRVRGGLVSLGASQYGSDGALGFADGIERAELVFDAGASKFVLNRGVNVPGLMVAGELSGRVGGTRTGELEGFALVEGIAPADLLASTRDESIAGGWTFLGGARVEGTLRAETIRLEGTSSIRLVVKNTGSEAIATGDAVKWAGMSGGVPAVEKLSDALDGSTPFAGIAVGDAEEDEEFVIARWGLVSAAVDGSFGVGEELTWSGGGVNGGTPRIGFALEAGTGTGSAMVILSGGF